MVIAIDGPAGSGKTTTANKVAKLLQFVHINTGAMYRGITLKLIHSKTDYRDIKRVEKMFKQIQTYVEIFKDGVVVVFIFIAKKLFDYELEFIKMYYIWMICSAHRMQLYNQCKLESSESLYLQN